MKKLLFNSSGLLAGFMLLTGSRLFAAQGDLDSTFGTGGRVSTSLGANNLGYDLAIQDDGKILVTGGSSLTSRDSSHISVLRYNPNGTLDTGFNSTGYVTTVGGSHGQSVAVQENGKILVAGGAYGDVALVRYNGDGSLDPTFNATGKVVTDFGASDIATSVAIQEDGKILLAGWTGSFSGNNTQDFLVARYHPDGRLDTTFGSGGKVLTDFGRDDQANSVVVQSDGKIFVTGRSWTYATASFVALARYSADGSPDTSFNATGKLTLDLIGGGYGSANSATQQADGKILIAGRAASTSVEDFAVIRLNRDGSLDTSFGGDGVVTTDFGVYDEATSIVALPGGKLVAGGIARGGDFALARYNSDGGLDTTFGAAGKVISNFTPNDVCNRIAVQRDGKILAGGYTYDGFTVVRYLGEPPPAIRVEHPDGEWVSIPVSFGEVAAGTADERILTIRNNGNETLTGLKVTKSAMGMPGEFFVEPPPTDTLAPGATTTFNVTFSPAAPGLRTATLVIAADGGAPATITLEGTQPFQEIAIEQPAGADLIDGNAAPVDFGPVAAGASAELTFTIRNTGGTLLTGLGISKTLAGTPSQFSVGPLGTTTLPPQSSVTFTVTFSPAAAGPATATLWIASNDEDENPFEINLTGTFATALEAWRRANFGTGFNTGAGADLNDADGDGMVNLLEFALATDPNSKTVPPGSLAKNGNRLEFSYARPIAALAELDYRLEWSDSMSGTWTTVGSTTDIISDDGVMQQVKFGVPAGPFGRRFTRLRVRKL